MLGAYYIRNARSARCVERVCTLYTYYRFNCRISYHQSSQWIFKWKLIMIIAHPVHIHTIYVVIIRSTHRQNEIFEYVFPESAMLNNHTHEIHTKMYTVWYKSCRLYDIRARLCYVMRIFLHTSSTRSSCLKLSIRCNIYLSKLQTLINTISQRKNHQPRKGFSPIEVFRVWPHSLSPKTSKTTSRNKKKKL